VKWAVYDDTKTDTALNDTNLRDAKTRQKNKERKVLGMDIVDM